MSRADLAAASGISINTMMKLEQGSVSDPGIFRVNALAGALQARLDVLVDAALNDIDSGAPMTAGVISIGYEGREVDEFVKELVGRGVSTLVDVRWTPVSRKRGFSKTRLRDALESAGVAYRHERALGNPKDNRSGFRADEPAAIDRYETLLIRDEGKASLKMLGELARSEIVAVLCFEKVHAECHRRLVIDALGAVEVELA